MSNTPTNPTAQPGGFLSKIQGLQASAQPAEQPAESDDVLPTWDNVPVAIPVDAPADQENIPMAVPVTATAFPLPVPVPVGEEPPLEEPELEAAEPPKATSITCPYCTATNPITESYCSDCGGYFSKELIAAAMAVSVSGSVGSNGSGEVAMPQVVSSSTSGRLMDRFELGELVNERRGVQRYRGVDHQTGERVTIIRQALPPTEKKEEPAAKPPEQTDEIMPSFDESAVGSPVTEILPDKPTWPGISWERRLLRTLEHPALPTKVAHFCDETSEYHVQELPKGPSLGEVWDDPDLPTATKFGYLIEVAETLHRLHQCGAMFEGIRPDHVVIQDGHARLTCLGDLLPLPMAADVPVRGGPYSAPELKSNPGSADARADLYSFGAMLYSLRVGRELNERTDFDGPGNPKPFIPRFPDEHPLFGRLMMKTFRKGVESRFPTDEASREDATGFTELIRTLEVLKRNYELVRMEVASWTSTGIVRTGNEDAFAVMHACESRQDDCGEAALIILCDGMGGYEAGEVAAALTIQSLRQQLSHMRPFSVATGASPFLTDPQTQMSKPEGHSAPPIDVNAVKMAIKTALRDANKLVFQTSRMPGSKRRGMGCTAEVVYVDGRNVVVGHVGDSRTYHLHEGRLIQMTRDQTLVNRLVELGTLSAEEAETHPRRNELQQAIGGQPDVDPGLYSGKMSAGDWIVVCSDGLTNHVTAKDLQDMLQNEGTSAELVARRLVNLTLIEGATDNVTVVVVRCPAAAQ